MNTFEPTSKCAPLTEACTLELYKKNIFRITGLPVDATAKEIARQAQKLQMLEEMGGGAAGQAPSFAPAVAPTSDEIRSALSRMRESQHRIVDEFFWYWPEEFGASKNDPAIQAMMSGDTDGAVNHWRRREKEGSLVAKHNMAVMYHMYAVDWSLHQISYEIDPNEEKSIKIYWRKAFERWEALADSDEIRDILKQRILSLNDEALTTGFVRRFLAQLPQAFDQVNAEAALKLAEQNRMDWARFHVDFMRETHQGLDDVDATAEMILAPTKARVEQHLNSFENKSEKEPHKGVELAQQLLDLCRPMMNLFDLFHGSDAHQRNDLFDRVAEMILSMSVGHQRATNDNETFFAALNNALNFASSPVLRERIIKNIAIAEGNLSHAKLEPIFQALTGIQEAKAKAAKKLERINKIIIPKLPEISQQYGDQSEIFANLCDSIAIVLKGISVDAHNDENDYTTAVASIQLASRLVKNPEFKARILADKKTIEKTTGTSVCFYCGARPGDANQKVEVPMHKVTEILPNGVRYQSSLFSVPRCQACYTSHRRHWQAIWWGAGAGALLGAPFAPWALVGGAMIAVLSEVDFFPLNC